MQKTRKLPISLYVFWDETVVADDEEVIREGISHLFDFLGIEKSQVKYMGKCHDEKFINEVGGLIPNKSAEWYMTSGWDPSRNQVNVNKVIALLLSSIRIHKFQFEVIFTNRDLYSSGSNFIIGGADGNFAIISFLRLSEIEDENLRKETQITEIFHEIGHLMGIPDEKRGNKNMVDCLGFHCKNPGCSMRQGTDVPNDWVRFTKERLGKNGKPYCSDCLNDLSLWP